MQLLVNVSRLVDGRVQLLGTVKATDKDIEFPDQLSPLMARAVPVWYPFLNPSLTFQQLSEMPPVVPMPVGAPLLIQKQWSSRS